MLQFPVPHLPLRFSSLLPPHLLFDFISAPVPVAQ